MTNLDRTMELAKADMRKRLAEDPKLALKYRCLSGENYFTPNIRGKDAKDAVKTNLLKAITGVKKEGKAQKGTHRRIAHKRGRAKGLSKVSKNTGLQGIRTGA